jgi:hypothetical protein
MAVTRRLHSGWSAGLTQSTLGKPRESAYNVCCQLDKPRLADHRVLRRSTLPEGTSSPEDLRLYRRVDSRLRVRAGRKATPWRAGTHRSARARSECRS